MIYFKNHFGFTLIELLITIGVVAVLSAGLMSLIGRGPQQTSRDARRQADLQKIASALELYRSDNGKYAPNLGTLTPSYLAQQLKDPQTNNVYGNYSCTGANCAGFTICVDLEKTVATCPNDYVVTNP